jgi:hypothetical protein
MSARSFLAGAAFGVLAMVAVLVGHFLGTFARNRGLPTLRVVGNFVLSIFIERAEKVVVERVLTSDEVVEFAVVVNGLYEAGVEVADARGVAVETLKLPYEPLAMEIVDVDGEEYWRITQVGRAGT